MTAARWNLGLALFCIAFAAFALLYWIPTDIETGVLEKERRVWVIGDGMGPFFLSVCMIILSVIMAFGSLRVLLRGEPAPDAGPLKEVALGDIDGGLSAENFTFLFRVLAIVIASMLLINWVGPLTAMGLKAIGHDVGTYRQLVATVPYKYLGFIAGGFVMVFGLISMIVGRMTMAGFLTAVFTIAALIILYDVPFDQLLLPPNGDQ